MRITKRMFATFFSIVLIKVLSRKANNPTTENFGSLKYLRRLWLFGCPPTTFGIQSILHISIFLLMSLHSEHNCAPNILISFLSRYLHILLCSCCCFLLQIFFAYVDVTWEGETGTKFVSRRAEILSRIVSMSQLLKLWTQQIISFY